MKFGSWFRASSPPKNRAGKPVGSGNTFPLKSFVHGQGVGADLIINSTASQEVGVVRPVKNENNYSPNSSVHRQVMRAAVSFNPAIVQEGGAIDLSPLVNNGKRLMRCEIVANDQAVSIGGVRELEVQKVPFENVQVDNCGLERGCVPFKFTGKAKDLVDIDSAMGGLPFKGDIMQSKAEKQNVEELQVSNFFGKKGERNDFILIAGPISMSARILLNILGWSMVVI
ncbi:hypothetical protein ACOSP7_002428 [Xanthoceras sorbifolium]